MKVRIDADEWYPVYMMEPDDGERPDWGGAKVEVSQEMWNAYTEAYNNFRAMQKVLRSLCGEDK